MKYCSKKCVDMGCLYVKEANIANYILFATFCFMVPLYEERKHDVTVPKSYGIRPTNDRHTMYQYMYAAS